MNMKTRNFFILFVLFVFIQSIVYPQTGANFESFKKKLQPYFAEELISDIEKEMPKNNFTIWGWDVGDFSGDGYYDVAFTIRDYSVRGKVMQVFMFIDVDGFLVKVFDKPFKYYEIPLETGIIIRDNSCYITQKNKQYDWDILGYRFDNGALIKLDEFSTERIKRFTHETYRNYVTLQNTEKYFYTSNKKVKFYTDYLSIPSYRRGRYVYKGYSAVAEVDNINYVPAGAYFWTGKDDLFYQVSSAYDEDYLYMTVKVKDDVVASYKCADCANDRVELWLDLYQPDTKSDRFIHRIGKNIRFRQQADSGIYNFVFSIGNFLQDRAQLVELNTNENMDDKRKEAVNMITASSRLTEEGYMIKFRIPFEVFGYSHAPLKDGEITEFGCNVIVDDIDNTYLPKEVSRITISKFDSTDPKTYASLMLVPDEFYYGENRNIYKDQIVDYINELGF